MKLLFALGATCLLSLGLASSAINAGTGGNTAKTTEALSTNAPDAQVALMNKMATLFRSARKTVSENQGLINDETKGDKGLNGKAVIAQTKANFKSATGADLAELDDSTLEGRAQAAMLRAIDETMTEAQPLINEQGKAFKGFLPAVFAKRVADGFSSHMKGSMVIKLTAPKSYVRNRANRPDSWEHEVIETKFKSEGWATGTEFIAAAPYKGKAAQRLLLPEYYSESCLKCHGGPKGERDITGGKKEGGVLGELGGAISVGIYE